MRGGHLYIAPESNGWLSVGFWFARAVSRTPVLRRRCHENLLYPLQPLSASAADVCHARPAFSGVTLGALAPGDVLMPAANLRHFHGRAAEAPARHSADFDALSPPGAGVAAGDQGMRDLVQDRVAHLVDLVEERQRPRERDHLSRRPAAAKPPLGPVELEPPVGQPVRLHQLPREQASRVHIHPSILAARPTRCRAMGRQVSAAAR